MTKGIAGEIGTEEFMRVLLFVTIWASLAAAGLADPPDTGAKSCYEQLLEDTILGDTVVVLTTDSIIIGGIRPVYLSASSLYLRSETKQGVARSFAIPFENIDMIIYSKRGDARVGLALLGLGAGILTGVMIDMEVDQGSQGWFDFNGVIGGVIGGLVGTACGAIIGSQITTKVRLQCR
jgi:hypothetical protein